jgi:hypothetical protein
LAVVEVLKNVNLFFFVIQDYHEISSRLVFSQMTPALSIKDHDMIYWIGDLNYRITDLVSMLSDFFGF